MVASNGIAVTVDEAVSTVDFCPSIIVCGGIEVHRFESPTALAWLRRLVRRGTDIGAVCTGTHVVTRAGLPFVTLQLVALVALFNTPAIASLAAQGDWLVRAAAPGLDPVGGLRTPPPHPRRGDRRRRG